MDRTKFVMGLIYMIWIAIVLQAALIAISVSIDAFAVSFAYGCKKIKIPAPSLLIINLICAVTIGLSFFFGSLIMQHIPVWVAAALSFTILFSIGIIKLFDSITKSIIRKHTKFNKEINLSVFNFKLILRLYADPESADADVSKSISPKEASALALSLSLDGFAVGFGAAMIGVNGLALILFTLVTGFAALLLGSKLGNKAADKLKYNISWLAGVLLIGLAVVQLV